MVGDKIWILGQIYVKNTTKGTVLGGGGGAVLAILLVMNFEYWSKFSGGGVAVVIRFKFLQVWQDFIRVRFKNFEFKNQNI